MFPLPLLLSLGTSGSIFTLKSDFCIHWLDSPLPSPGWIQPLDHLSGPLWDCFLVRLYLSCTGVPRYTVLYMWHYRVWVEGKNHPPPPVAGLWCLVLFIPRCGSWYFSLLNLVKFLCAHFSRLSGPLWAVAHLSCVSTTLASFTALVTGLQLGSVLLIPSLWAWHVRQFSVHLSVFHLAHNK